jgi:hypothetical protein
MEKAFWVVIVGFYGPQDVPKDFPPSTVMHDPVI